MAFPNEANILRRTLTAFGSLVSSLRNRQWGLLRDASGNYSQGGFNRNNGSLIAKDDQGLIHEYWERQQVENRISEILNEAAQDFATASAAGLQIPWTSTGIEWAHYDSGSGNFLSWTATPSGNYDFTGSVEYAVDSFGNLLLRGFFTPPAAVASFNIPAGLKILRIENNIIDSGIAGLLAGVKYAPQVVTAIAAGGGTEPLWLWKGWFEFPASNQLSFALKDDTNGGAYARPGSGQSVHFTRVVIPKVAPVAQGVAAAAAGIATADGNTISFTGDGTNPLPLSAEVIIDPDPANALSSSAAGLFAQEMDLGNVRFINDLTDLAAFFAEAVDVGTGILTAEIVLNHGNNIFPFYGRKQLYFGAIVGHSDSDITFNKTGGYGSVYIYCPFAFGAGGSIAVDSGGMAECWLKRASQIGGAVTFTASGWGTGAYYETTQNALVTMGAGWTQQYWDDTSGDSRAAADSSDSVPAFVVDKLCDSDENAFPVAVVGGVRKVKISAGFGKKMFVVGSLAELTAALQDATFDEKHIFRSNLSAASPWSITGAISGIEGTNILHSQGSNGWSINGAAFASAAGAFLMLDPDVSIAGSNTADKVYLRAPILSVSAATSLALTSCNWIVESLSGAGASGIAASIIFDRIKNPLLPVGVSASGFVAYRYGAGGAVTPRSIAAAAGSGLSVSNADGVNGNPTIDSAGLALNCDNQVSLTDYTFTGSERRNSGFAVSTTAANRTINCSPDLFATGYELTICKFTNDSNTATIDAGSGNNIDGAQTYVLRQYGETITLIKDGDSTWKIKSSHLPNPMNASGDLIRGGVGGVPTRIPVGSNGQVLKVVSGAPAWAAEGGGSSAKAFTFTFGRWLNGWLSNAIQFPPGAGWNGSSDDGVLAPNVATKIPVACTLKAVSFYAVTYGAGNATLSLNKNGSLTTIGTITGGDMNFTGLSISIAAGDKIWFETSAPTSGGNCKAMTIAAYFEA